MTHKKGKGMTGRKHTEETKRKISLKHLGRRKLNFSKEFYIKNYIEYGKSMKEISIKLGVSEFTIWYELKRFDIPIRKHSDYEGYWKGKKNPKLSENKHKQFIEGMEEKFKPRKLNPIKNEIIKLYTESKISIPKISKLFNCSITSVHNLLIRNNIPRRKIGYALIGKIPPNYGIPHTEETKKKIGQAIKGYKKSKEEVERIKIIRSKMIFPMRDTSIELKVQNFLKELKIVFFMHYYCQEITHAYQCDILIPVQKSQDFFIKQPIIIECFGNYFHCNPIIYKLDFILFPNHKNKIIAQDKWDLDNLRTKELGDKGYIVIILWERDIKVMNLDKFKEIIENQTYKISH